MIKTLFSKDARNALRVWEVESEEDGFMIRQGLYGGTIQDKFIEVYPKSTRTMEEQIALEMNSRISKQLDKGYTPSIQEARNNRKTNSLGLLKPMLATPIDKVNNVDLTNAVIQRKYNGHRCLIHCEADGSKIAYSRNGKPIKTVDHILRELNILPNTTIDGELYVHQLHLQSIGSLIKKQQEDSRLLRLVAYDLVSNDTYRTRLEELHRIDRSPYHKVAETFVLGEDDPTAWMDKFVTEGYEGAIVRLDNFGYADGKRSKGLIKYKPKYDEEFTVVDILVSKDGWAILVCLIPWKSKAEAFRVAAPGTIYEKTEVLRNKQNYIGLQVNVEYYDLTKDKVPFHPVATYWRKKGEE